jgi:hypothetical protein
MPLLPLREADRGIIATKPPQWMLNNVHMCTIIIANHKSGEARIII